LRGADIPVCRFTGLPSPVFRQATGKSPEPADRNVCPTPLPSAAYRRATEIPHSRCDLLTVDVWDTLLRRHCHPDEIKLFTARYLLLTRADALKPAFKNAVALVEQRIRCEQALGQQR